MHVTFINEDMKDEQIANITWTANKLGAHVMVAGLWIVFSKDPFDEDQAHYAAEDFIETAYANDLETQAVMQEDLHNALPFKPHKVL